MYNCQLFRYGCRDMASTRSRTPRGQGAALRDRLLDAATELIDEHGGTAGVSIRLITKRAGVSPMALYLHFEDRETLLREVIFRGFDRFLEAIEAGRDAHETPRDRLLGMGVAYLAFARAQPAFYTVIFGRVWPTEDGPPDPEPAEPKDPEDPGRRALQALVDAVEACGPDGADGWVTALGLWSGLHGFATLTATRPLVGWPPEEAFVRRLLDVWIP